MELEFSNIQRWHLASRNQSLQQCYSEVVNGVAFRLKWYDVGCSIPFSAIFFSRESVRRTKIEASCEAFGWCEMKWKNSTGIGFVQVCKRKVQQTQCIQIGSHIHIHIILYYTTCKIYTIYTYMRGTWAHCGQKVKIDGWGVTSNYSSVLSIPKTIMKWRFKESIKASGLSRSVNVETVCPTVTIEPSGRSETVGFFTPLLQYRGSWRKLVKLAASNPKPHARAS